MKLINLKHITLLIATLLTLPCCYSWRGSVDIPAQAKTVSVQFFPSYAPLASPTLSPAFTEALRDYMQSQTRLALVEKGADLQFEGSITGYHTAPASIQTNDQAALNRLSITVAVKYINKLDENRSFETSFTRFADYPSAQTLSAVEADLIREINRQLVDDIFNKAFNNW